MDTYSLADTISTVSTTFWTMFWIGIIAWAMVWGSIGAILAEYKGERANLWKWWLVCTLFGVIAVSVLACTPRRKATGSPGVAPVPEDVGVTHDEVTLVATDLHYGPAGFGALPAEQQPVMARVEMTNYGAQPIAYSARRFTLEGVTDGQRYAARLLCNGQPFCGVLQPGDTVRGDVVFRVPAGDQEWQLRWEPRGGESVVVPFSSWEATEAPAMQPATAM